MNVYEDSGNAMQLAVESEQRLARAMMAQKARLVARFRAWLGRRSI
jgi:hypothetical protein